MAINPISSNIASAYSPPKTSGSFDGMDGAAFMQLLLIQMKNQNPLEPMQDKEFMGQITQLNSLSQLEQMNSTLKTLLTKAEPKPDLAQAATLIGKTVEAKDANGQTVTGVVSGVRLTNGVIMLTVGAAQVALASVTRVSAPPAPAAAAAPIEPQTPSAGRL